ncbi:MAG TPA: M1 family metallopeptidase, partial [Phaeodactylibacter sp.]|nr:M1 family metallopeptidase [Phaeodactylibacter sp.]
AQCYPRMAVLDDVTGWNNLPYLGPGEFYCEYGTFEYAVTVPAGFVVAGSGTLQNPKEVLGRDLASRLDNAVESDTAQFIIAPEEIGQALPASEETITWRYQMDNTRDVAWACSPAFVWDAAGAKRPDGSRILVQSFYPMESYGGWRQATAYAKGSLEHYSEQWFPYPYASLSNVAGGVGGMEYPGLHFTGYRKKGNSLWVTLDHEVAHNWFPMIVGSNEREHAWMDESFVTFMGYYAAEAYTGDDFNSYISNPQMMMRRFMEAGLAPVMTPPRRVQEGFSDVVYFKPAIALYLLREYVLGKERFDYAFRTYIEHWAYKHPQPEDFFRAMENGSGEQLDWFWQGWFYESGDLDQSISSASQSDQGRLRIDLENRLDMPMPAVLEITYEDGSTETRRFPVDVWANEGRFSTRLQLDKPVAELRLDPDGMLPDVEPRNNVWKF